jgi:uncharacterized protein YjcR
MINLHIRRTDKQPYDVELILNQSETSYRKGKLDSNFIDERLYDLFASCFANSVSHDNQFNYYGATKFRRDELLKLRTFLSEVESDFSSITSYRSLEEYLGKEERKKHTLRKLNEDFDMEFEWEEVLIKIIEVNRALINIVSRCIRETHILWVLGL